MFYFLFVFYIMFLVKLLKKYPGILEYFSVFIVIFMFIFSGIFGLSGLVHPKLLLCSEIIKKLSLPSFLTSDKILNLEFTKVSQFFKHIVFYTNSKNKYDFENNHYIKCLMPHGIVPFSLLCLWGDQKEVFHWNKNTFVTSHQFYNFPFISHYAKKLGGIPSNYQNMINVLKHKQSLIVYPGGIREMFACSHKKDVIVIKKRRGIFHMALKTGTPLLPVYTFGITDLYERSGVSVTLPFFFKNDRDSIAWYFGKYYTPFPMRKKLFTVVGNPINVVKKRVITEKDICDLRQKYISEIENIFYVFKNRFGFGNKKLKIK